MCVCLCVYMCFYICVCLCVYMYFIYIHLFLFFYMYLNHVHNFFIFIFFYLFLILGHLARHGRIYLLLLSLESCLQLVSFSSFLFSSCCMFVSNHHEIWTSIDFQILSLKKYILLFFFTIINIIFSYFFIFMF